MTRSPREVIASYLSELLTEESVAPEAAMTGATDLLDQDKRDRLQALLDEQFRVAVPEPEVEPEVEPEMVPPPEAWIPEETTSAFELPVTADSSDNIDVLQPVEPEPQSRSKIALEWAPNGRPLWAQTEFEVLLFQVAGLTLAVPLLALGQIYPITAQLTPVVGQAAWFMGLQPTSRGLIRTVNTALLVMPERYHPECLANVKYLVTLDGLDWGLVVDAVRHPSMLQPDDVSWRGQRSQRPWLAGTVKSAMCALLDISQVERTLTGACQ